MLGDLGIRVVISSGFADIFAGNAFKNGLLLVTLPPDAVGRLLAVAQEGQPITVDLDNQVVTTPFQDRFEFAMDPFRKQCLISGQDEIGLTLGMANVITAHEARLAAERPWIAGAAHRVS
jgi:3-isopropylmalate dehydratase small subunit